MSVKSVRLQNKHNFNINFCRRKGWKISSQRKKEISFYAFVKELIHENILVL